MRPFLTVESNGFQNLLKVLEPRYIIPSRKSFSKNYIPNLYEECKKV